MFGIGSQELLVIFLVVLLLFGAERIPEVARAVGKSIREFKRAAGEIESELQQVARQRTPPAGPSEKRQTTSGDRSGESMPLPSGADGGGTDSAPEAPSEKSTLRPPERD